MRLNARGGEHGRVDRDLVEQPEVCLARVEPAADRVLLLAEYEGSVLADARTGGERPGVDNRPVFINLNLTVRVAPRHRQVMPRSVVRPDGSHDAARAVDPQLVVLVTYLEVVVVRGRRPGDDPRGL